MIRSFRHKGLQRFFETGDTSAIPKQFAAKLARQLTILSGCDAPQGMNMPGYRLHKLTGDRKGHWSVWVSGNWRLVFAFEDTMAVDVDLVDYH